MYIFRRARLLAVCILCLTALLSLSACSSSIESMTDTSTAEAFLDGVMGDRYDEAYALLSETVAETDFAPVWRDLRTLFAEASAYEMDAETLKQRTALSGGKTVIEQTYIVTLNNGCVLTYRVVMQEGTAGLVGMHYRDVTAFVTATDRYIPTVNRLLWVLAAAFLAFRVWMLVDCLRRKMAKGKALWVVVILLGLTLTLTVGDTLGFRFGPSILFDRLSLAADPLLYALTASVSLPIGAFVYFLKRKKIRGMADAK